LASISRPTMNFCRLPPDSERAAAFGPPALTLKRLDDVRRLLLQRLDRIQPLLPTRSVRVSSRFCASPSVRHRAAAQALLRHEVQARARGGAPGRAARGWPPTWIASCAARAGPRRRARTAARAGRCRRRRRCPPLAGAHFEGDVVEVDAELVLARQRQPAHAQHHFARLALVVFQLAGGSAPIIRRDSEALLSRRGSQTPVTLPPRITVQALHSSRISCSLWLM
jgi:hypothetical protein